MPPLPPDYPPINQQKYYQGPDFITAGDYRYDSIGTKTFHHH